MRFCLIIITFILITLTKGKIMKNKYYLLSLFALASASAFGATVKVIENETWNSLGEAGVSAGDTVEIAGGKSLNVNFNSSGDDSKLLTFKYAGSTNTTNTSVNFGSAETGSATEYKNFQIYSAKNHLNANFYENSSKKITFSYKTSDDISYDRAIFSFGNNAVVYDVAGNNLKYGTATTFNNYLSLTINVKNLYTNTTSFASSGDVIINTDDGITQLAGTVLFNGKTTINTSTLKISGITVFQRSSDSTGLITINAGELVGTSNAMIVGRGIKQKNIIINSTVDLSGNAQKVFLNSTTSLTLNGDSKLNIFDLTDNVGDDGLYYKDTTNRTQGAVTTKLTIGSGADVSIKTLGMYNTNSVLNIEFANATGSLTIDAFDIIADGYDADHIAGTGDIGISIVGSVFEQIKIKEGIKVGDTVVDKNNFTNYFTAEEGMTLSLTSAGDGYYYVNATTAVPEPAEWAMIFGAVALGFVAYKRRK